MSASLLKQALQRHPAAPAPAGLALVVHRLPADDPARPLRLRFEVEGDPALVRWPAPLAEGEAPRRDGLWRHTCFEAFVGAAAGAGYVEYNFSPSGAWAAYRFDRYREGMRSEPVVAEPRILVSRTAVRTSIEVAASWPTGGAAPDPRTRAGRARLGLTAVIEAVDGGLSYWALGHPEGRPDFHNDAGFRLEVEVPG